MVWVKSNHISKLGTFAQIGLFFEWWLKVSLFSSTVAKPKVAQTFIASEDEMLAASGLTFIV